MKKIPDDETDNQFAYKELSHEKSSTDKNIFPSKVSNNSLCRTIAIVLFCILIIAALIIIILFFIGVMTPVETKILERKINKQEEMVCLFVCYHILFFVYCGNLYSTFTSKTFFDIWTPI